MKKHIYISYKAILIFLLIINLTFIVTTMFDDKLKQGIYISIIVEIIINIISLFVIFKDQPWVIIGDFSNQTLEIKYFYTTVRLNNISKTDFEFKKVSGLDELFIKNKKQLSGIILFWSKAQIVDLINSFDDANMDTSNQNDFERPSTY